MCGVGCSGSDGISDGCGVKARRGKTSAAKRK